MDRLSGVEVEARAISHETETVSVQFDPEKTPATLVVIASLADVLDVDPVELTPLYDTIDPDALDSLVRARSGKYGGSQAKFAHENHTITVHSYGMVSITPERTTTEHEWATCNDE